MLAFGRPRDVKGGANDVKHLHTGANRGLGLGRSLRRLEDRLRSRDVPFVLEADLEARGLTQTNETKKKPFRK
jgi:hypothetical protein